jgi:hypothetical protein
MSAEMQVSPLESIVATRIMSIKIPIEIAIRPYKRKRFSAAFRFWDKSDVKDKEVFLIFISHTALYICEQHTKLSHLKPKL